MTTSSLNCDKMGTFSVKRGLEEICHGYSTVTKAEVERLLAAFIGYKKLVRPSRLSFYSNLEQLIAFHRG